MTSPIDLMARGIQEGNWTLVQDGFQILTGQSLQAPVATQTTDNPHYVQLTQLAETLHDGTRRLLAILRGDTERVGRPPEDHPETTGTLPREPEPLEPTRPARSPARPSPCPSPRPKRPRRPKAAAVAGADTPDAAPVTEPAPAHTAEVNAGERRPARVEPARAGVNTWKDDRSLAREAIADSRKVSRKASGRHGDSRPEFRPVEVRCSRCSQTAVLHPALLPKKLDLTDESPAYVCDRCLGGMPRSS